MAREGQRHWRVVPRNKAPADALVHELIDHLFELRAHFMRGGPRGEAGQDNEQPIAARADVESRPHARFENRLFEEVDAAML
jgi:hypothetical protein